MTKSMIFAHYLYCHPFEVCFGDYGVAFWYDSDQGKFFSHNPGNKVRTGNYEAKGLKSYLDQYFGFLVENAYCSGQI